MFNTSKLCRTLVKQSRSFITYKCVEKVHNNYKHLNKIDYKELLAPKPVLCISSNCQFSQNNNNNKNSQNDEETSNEELNIAELTGGDSVLEKKLKILFLEVEVLRQENNRIPSPQFIKQQHWKQLLTLETRTARRRYLGFLFQIEKKKENRLIKKQQKREEYEKIVTEKSNEIEDDGHIKYGLRYNTIYIRIYDTTINQLTNNKLIQAMQFGQKLIIDCGYDQHMTNREQLNAAKQLTLLFSENRSHDDPFDLHFCNSDFNGETIQALHRFIPPLTEPWFPLHVHKENYLDLFPKEKLVYLTPHCRDTLDEYDHEALYIVGAMVDKVNNEPLSLAKAKREGLKMAKLPLDRYLQWGAGSGKSLTLNQVVSILLDIKTTGDWKYALRHVPRRKIVEFDECTGGNNFNNNFREMNRNERFTQINNKKFKNRYEFQNSDASYRRKKKTGEFNMPRVSSIFEK